MKNNHLNTNIPANSIAIVGMSCRVPGAENIAEFWHNLANGVESLTHFTDEELLDAGVDSSWLDNPRYVKANAILKDVTSFDAEFFDVPPREAEVLDPQQRLFLECAWEALESAGIDPLTYEGNVGVYSGMRSSEYLMFNQDPIDQVGFTTESPIVVTQRHWANDKDFLATRASFKLNLRGPAMTVQTACSTSLVTIHLAVQSLLVGESDIALAGGVTVRVPQRAGYVFSEGMIFSPDGHTRSFDAQASGTIFSSGVGVITLKRLEDALADNDQIFAVIRGTAVNNDGGGEKTRYSAPTVKGQASVILEAQEKAGVAPDTISYIEAHGTATAAGDPIEIAGLTTAFRENTAEKGYCAIGSVKSNIGHTVQAAGVLGVIKVALMMQNCSLVPTVHFTEPNPRIDFENSPFFVNMEYGPWPEGETPRRAGVSSFGVGGTNAHVILEEAPILPETAASPDTEYTLTLTTKNEDALRDLAQAYQHFFENNPDANLADVCFTASNGRSHFNHRLAIMAKSAAEMGEKLAEIVADEMPIDSYRGESEEAPNPVAFLFTGQGAQYNDMGRQLYEAEPLFREMMDHCAELLQPYLEVPLLDVIYPAEGENPLIHETAYTQPALFAVEYSLATLWQSWGIQPTHVMGHSVGEYVAACVAGIMSLEDGLKLIAERGRLMQSLPQEGKMAVIFASEAQVKQAMADYASQLSIAAVNGPSNIVISGVREAVEAVVAKFEADNVRTRPLTTSHAFHSQLMEPILDDFEQVAASVQELAPKLTVISNVTGRPLALDSLPTATYWRNHVRNAVRFADAVDYLAEIGCTTFVEIGPNPTLLGMARRCLPDLAGLWLPSVRKGQDAWRQMRQSLAQLYVNGATVDWLTVYPLETARRIELPKYPFQRKRFWIERTVDKGETAVSSNLFGADSHPLLGRRLHSPLAETQYLAELNPETLPFLQEHRAFEQITLPATAYVEMVHTAASELFGAERPYIQIKDLVIHQALLFPDGDEQTVQLVLLPGDAGQAEFKVYSLQHGEKTTWTLHVGGKVIGQKQADSDALLEPEAVQARLPEKLPIDDFYQEKRDKGIFHGLPFRGVREVWRADGEALAWIRLPRIARSGQHQYRMHPALLDACIQISGATLPTDGQSDALYLPMVWEQIRFFAPVPHELWSHAKIKGEIAPGAELFSVDLELFDGEGQLVAQVRGLHFKRARRDALLQGTAVNPEKDWQHQLAWQVQRLAEAEAVEGRVPQHWLIFADASGVGTAVSNALKAQGHTTQLVVPAGSSNLNGDESTAVQIKDHEQLDGLFRQIATAKQGAETGILYGWGIDSADFGPTDPNSVIVKQETAVGGLMQLVQSLTRNFSSDQPSPKLWVMTQGSQPAGWQPGPFSVAQATLWGLGKVIVREHPELDCTLLDVDPATDDFESILAELTTANKEKQIALRGDTRFVARLVPHFAKETAENSLLELPESKMYRLESKEPGTFDGLNLEPMTRRTPARDEVEIEIRATGLNFRDVLIALGRFEDVIGRECSGVVVACGEDVSNVQVGDEVMAIAAESFASYVTIKSHYVVPKPRHLSFAEAATVPMVFLTAFYGLHTLANMQPGDRVLIHAASGGVGHAAIQLAQQCGAEIYATASQKKWPYLRSLGLKNILNSRTLDFADDIMQMTDGKGVDIVLNSLAGDFITKSVDCLAENGRFIEIGATDVWDEDRMAAVRPDVAYHWFHLGQSVAQKKPDFFQEMFQQVAEQFATGAYKPLPRYSFQIQEAIDAFRFMSQAKHIGKVVVTHQLPTDDQTVVNHKRIHADGTYLITGGLGGLGLKVANWLADNGADHLLLLGRSAPSETAVSALTDLQNRGVNAVAAQADVADMAALEKVLAEANEMMPPLRGVIHAAGVLADGILQQQSWQSFAKVFAPKVDGAWNLHRLTEHLPLDFFVLFSSVSSLWGGAGQGNYAAANAFLDTLAHYRQARGLTAVSINWGAWSEVGMAADMGEAIERRRALSGMGKISPELGMNILNRILHADAPQVGVIPADWSRYVQQFSADVQQTFLAELAQKEDGVAKKSAKKADSHSKVLARLETAVGDERETILVDYVQTEIARIGGMEKSKLELDHALDEMGIDSLMAIELRNRIATDLQVDVPMSEFLSNPSIAYMADLLGAQSQPASAEEKSVEVEETAAPANEPASEETEPTNAPEPVVEKKWSPIVPMKSDGTNVPLFCVHGVGGHTMRMVKLARHLDAKQSLYGFQAQGLDGKASRLDSVEAMAAQYIDAMVAHQPNGPYVVAGYSFGSYVAYEMACQMVEQNLPIGALVLFDGKATELPLYNETLDLRSKAVHLVSSLQEKQAFHARRMSDLSTGDRLTYMSEIVTGGDRVYDRRKPAERYDKNPYDDSETSKVMNQMIKHNLALSHKYLPRPYAGKITFYAATEDRGYHGWNHLAQGGVELIPVPGSHMSIMEEPSVQVLAKEVGKLLDKISR
ncbi:SDR family NAD(P)-dependent oxidoreductase [Candidatus Leptofilum sp.]|uniref:SDR family NAD(P)-dependent oxidoreductase n=1 Tax=Candidatus Leptofilum sp. TaxID=3241576 RepID=UPI003B5C07BB